MRTPKVTRSPLVCARAVSALRPTWRVWGIWTFRPTGDSVHRQRSLHLTDCPHCGSERATVTAHNPKVGGSNPPPATIESERTSSTRPGAASLGAVVCTGPAPVGDDPRSVAQRIQTRRPHRTARVKRSRATRGRECSVATRDMGDTLVRGERLTGGRAPRGDRTWNPTVWAELQSEKRSADSSSRELATIDCGGSRCGFTEPPHRWRRRRVTSLNAACTATVHGTAPAPTSARAERCLAPKRHPSPFLDRRAGTRG
jgi:hypothetical protein